MLIVIHKRCLAVMSLVCLIGCTATNKRHGDPVANGTVVTAQTAQANGAVAKQSTSRRTLSVLPASSRKASGNESRSDQIPDGAAEMRSNETELSLITKATAQDAESVLDTQLRHAAEVDTMELSDVVDAQLRHSQEAYDPMSRSGSSPQSGSSLNSGNIGGSIRPRDGNSLPSDFRIISEAEMLTIALTKSPVLRTLGVRILDNPGAASTIYDTAISQSDPFFGPDAALAEFDNVMSANLNAQNNDRVFNNATLGGQVQELTQDLVNYNTGLQKRTMSGATWELNSLTGYDNNNRAGNRFRNYWETQMELGVRQPLLQGAGKEFNSIAGPNARPGFNFSNGIVIARLNNKISQHDFEIALRSYVRELYQAYWELVRQYHTYESVLAARELSYETWQTVRAKGSAELEGGEANKEAQARAKYYNYRREVQIALGGETGRGGLYIAERQLRQLIGLPAVDGQLLKPADEPVSARFVFDFDHITARAMSGRTELRRQSIKVNQQRLRLLAAKNFLLPQMDLIGRYRLRGFGDDLIADGPRFSSAYDDFASFDHQEWEFGLEMGVVHGRRQAHAAVRNAKFQLSRERAILEEQKRVITHEVSNSYAEVGSSYYAMESSTQQVEASRERLEASEALYQADKIQIEFLLDAQEELLRAELQLAIDQSRYTLSLVDINNSSGTLLNDIGVRIGHSCCGSRVSYMHNSLASPNSTSLLNERSVVYPPHTGTPSEFEQLPVETKLEPDDPRSLPKLKDIQDKQEPLPMPKGSPDKKEDPRLPELPKLPDTDALDASHESGIPSLKSPRFRVTPATKTKKQSSISRFVSGIIPKHKFSGPAESVPTQKASSLSVPTRLANPPTIR